jgi:DNA-binding transcriptional MerR regulator
MSLGYRIYGEKEVDILQNILFFRELEFTLKDIKLAVTSSKFDEVKILEEHYKRLINKKNKIDILIENISATIKSKKGGEEMSDDEKFKGLKEKMIKDNDEKYGEEIREKYGKEAVEKSYNKIKNMTPEEHERITKLSEEIIEKLEIAFKEGNPESELAQEVANLHKEWLSFYWGFYSKEAHVNIANMYVEDERFKKYYDAKNPGTAEFLREAIKIFAK